MESRQRANAIRECNDEIKYQKSIVKKGNPEQKARAQARIKQVEQIKRKIEKK